MACRPFAWKAGGAQLYRQSAGIAVWGCSGQGGFRCLIAMSPLGISGELPSSSKLGLITTPNPTQADASALLRLLHPWHHARHPLPLS